MCEDGRNLFKTMEGVLADLNRLVEVLEKENEYYRQKAGVPSRLSRGDMSLERTVLKNCSIIDKDGKSSRWLGRVYNTLKRAGYNSLTSLEGKTVEDLHSIRRSGVDVTATVIVLCRHYGIFIIEDYEDMTLSLQKQFEQAIVKMTDLLRFE